MTFEMLLKRAAGGGLFGGARGMRVADVTRYLDGGGDVNRRSEAGQTLLHVAADNGQMDVIRLLVTRGADVNARGFHGYTPLHLAVDADCDTSSRGGRRATELPITALLIGLAADETIRDDDGETARDVAAAYGDAEVALYDSLARPRDR